MKLKFGKQEMIIASAVAVVLLTLLFWILFYRPASQEIANLKAEQQKVLKKIESSKLTLERMEESKKEASEVEAGMLEILKKMPEDPEIPTLLVQIESLAEKTGVQIQTFKPSPPVSSGEYQTITVDLSIKTRFNGIPSEGGNLIEFLYRLEKLPRLVSIQNLQIQKSPNDPALTVTLKLNAFSLRGIELKAAFGTK